MKFISEYNLLLTWTKAERFTVFFFKVVFKKERRRKKSVGALWVLGEVALNEVNSDCFSLKKSCLPSFYHFDLREGEVIDRRKVLLTSERMCYIYIFFYLSRF